MAERSLSPPEVDFSNFQLADIGARTQNVYDIGNGVIVEAAELLGVDLGVEVDPEAIGKLVGKIGKNKVLRHNKEVTAIDRETAVRLVEQSGVQKELNRSLWTPEFVVATSGDAPVSGAVDVDAVAMTGSVANWQDRTADIIERKVKPETPVAVVAGNRVMDTVTEKANPNVQQFLAEKGRYPTESEYGQCFIIPRFVVAFETVHDMTGYDTDKGDEIARLFFEDREDLLEGRVAFARVANAGIQLAVQMRTAAVEIKDDFDADPEDPQVFVLTDKFRIAKTEEHEAQPQSYQKAITALRQAALTGKLLEETAASLAA